MTQHPAQHAVSASTLAAPVQRNLDNLGRSLSSQAGLTLLGCLVIFGILSLLAGKGKKGKLTKGAFGGRAELGRAKRVALEQMRERRKNAVSVWVGEPSDMPWKRSPIYLPDAQRGIAVIGAPGTGKTVSVIDQAVYSVIRQGFPIVLWDFKYPTQTERIAGYAAANGYRVHLFAPGYEESETLNPIKEFLASDADSLMARQFAEVMNSNFKRSGQSSEDAFFGPAGDQVTEAILMLARGSRYPDLMMAQAIATLPDLPARIAANREHLNPWVVASFGQLLASAGSEKTVSSILATANLNLTRFIKGEILPAFTGETTVPTILKGKTLLVLGLDRQKRDVLAPLIATILHMLINRNVTIQRRDPLFLVADELPTLYLPALRNWLNENREDGMCSILGFQNIVQLEQLYGKELAKAILGGCATKVLFNPQEYESAKLFSDYLGEREVQYRTRSHGRSGGKGNTSYSEHLQTRPLMGSSEMVQLPTGRCIIVNPHFQRGKDSYIPVVESIELSKGYRRLIGESVKEWAYLKGRLARADASVPQDAAAASPSQSREVTREDLRERYREADRMLPEPSSKGGKKLLDNAALHALMNDENSSLYF